MLKTLQVAVFLCLALIGLAATASAENSVVLESRTFQTGQLQCTIGVFLSNSVGLQGIVLPLEFKSLSGGAYIASALSIDRQPGSRLYCSIFGPFPHTPCQADVCCYMEGIVSNRYFPLPSGPPCSSPGSSSYTTAAAQVDYVSPDAILSNIYSIPDEHFSTWDDFDPGSDPTSTDSASLVMTFAVNDSVGTFVIDSVCVRPAAHIGFVDNNTNLIPVAFTPSVVTLACRCDCHGRPADCDGQIDILDVVSAVQVAFASAPEIPDLNPLCPSVTSDVDCDGATTVVDVIHVIDVAFRGADPAISFCDPCAP